jgi:hypothetical protein
VFLVTGSADKKYCFRCLCADFVLPKIRTSAMNDPIARRLRDLLQITLMLRESIDELLSGLSQQLERESTGSVSAPVGVRRGSR